MYTRQIESNGKDRSELIEGNENEKDKDTDTKEKKAISDIDSKFKKKQE